MNIQNQASIIARQLTGEPEVCGKFDGVCVRPKGHEGGCSNPAQPEDARCVSGAHPEAQCPAPSDCIGADQASAAAEAQADAQREDDYNWQDLGPEDERATRIAEQAEADAQPVEWFYFDDKDLQRSAYSTNGINTETNALELSQQGAQPGVVWSQPVTNEYFGYKAPEGYSECLACGMDVMGSALCGYCRNGAYEYNYNPDDATEDPDFDTGNLEYWRAAGERIAEAEQAQADRERAQEAEEEERAGLIAELQADHGENA